jgi:hypothetical protein
VNNGAWFPRDFDVIIIELLQYALQGRANKLLFSLPRRHGKSTLISHNFISYFMAHYPWDDVILSSYTQHLASDFGRACKLILDEYGHLSPYDVRLSKDSKANNKFHLAKPYTGRMLAVGSNGGIIGFGASLFVVDDPIKNSKEAKSLTIQRNLEEWIMGTAKTSLETRANGLPPIMIIIAQRLNVNDLHGIIKQNEPWITGREALQILRNGGSIPNDVWVDVNFPAICENPQEDLLGRSKNQVLWSEQRDYEWLMAEKRAMGSFLFNAIYQGNPQQPEGFVFKREWFYDQKGEPLTSILTNQNYLPSESNKIRYWDFAASGDKGDAAAGMRTLYDDDCLVFDGLVHGFFTADQMLNRYISTTIKDTRRAKSIVEQESGSGTKLLIQRFKQDKRLKGYNIIPDKVNASKMDRSFDLEVLCETGRIRFNTSTMTLQDIKKTIDELINFTGEEGGEDNIVDTMTGSARYWATRKPGESYSQSTKKYKFSKKMKGRKKHGL